MENKRIREILERSFIGTFIKDEGITDVDFNGTELWVQHNQKGAYRAEIQPKLQEVQRLAKQIADVQKKELTNSEPILDTEIGYLRVNVVHDAVSPDGMSFSIRVSRPRLAIRGLSEMTTNKREEIEDLFKVLVRAGSNIIISGKTGAGKTELQKLLVGFIPYDQKIVLIEDTRDSHIKTLYPEKNIISWQTLLSDDRDKKVTIQDLVKAGLRNNPDWIIVSETRGSEASDMLDSAKTDHSIITTVHAKGAMNIPSRLIPMVRQSSAYQTMSEQLIGKEIAELLRFGIHLELDMQDEVIVRKIIEIVEYTDFTKKGVVGNYLFREKKEYDEVNKEYVTKEVFGKLSDQTLSELKNKRLFHLLPDVFIFGETS